MKVVIVVLCEVIRKPLGGPGHLEERLTQDFEEAVEFRRSSSCRWASTFSSSGRVSFGSSAMISCALIRLF